LDASQDKHLWSETYKGTIDDIFDMQEKVAGKIVDALRLQLTRDEKDYFQKRYTENTEAYQLYLQGRFFWNKRNEKALKSAILFFERAIQKDPLYALAWAGLGDSYFLLAEYSNISRIELLPKIMESVNKALEIDNSLAEAHTTLGILHMMCEWDWIKSEREFKLAIELSPRYATAHHWYSELLLIRDRIAEAFHEISLAVELDPVSQAILKDKGIFYYYTRQYDEAIDIGMKTLELDQKFGPAHRLLSLAYLGKGMIDEAAAANQQWGIATGNEVKTRIALAHIYAVAGRKKEAMQIVDEEMRNHQLTDNDYRGIAIVFTALGDKDRAFEWLERSLERHEESLCNLKIDPKMESLHSDPRFSAMVEKMGL
jgi:tetratricopeptide (TPR) repeat protein